ADIAVQVRSPVHDFPTLYRQYKITKTQLYGPEGWADAIQTLLANQLLSSSHSPSTLSSLNSGVNHG
ncbi:MAG: mannosyl-3-phosphoglycerate phosphatase, partial [Colwellia sp.]